MLHCEEYDITKLSPEQRRALAVEIFPVIQAISSVETLEDFIAEYNAPCWAMSMAVYRNKQRQVVGYARYKIAYTPIDGEEYALIRLDTSLHPDYKGKIPYKRFYFKEAFRLRRILQEPNLYALCLCLSPVPYYHIATHYRAVYPLPGVHDPIQEERLARLLAASGLSSMPGRPHVVKLLSQGFLEKPHERESWKRHPSPFIAFYLEQCPSYSQGEALAAIAHITAPRLVVGLFRMLLAQLRRRVGLL